MCLIQRHRRKLLLSASRPMMTTGRFIGLIGVYIFIYHGCNNLKHHFSNFIGLLVVPPVILKMFRFPAFLTSYGLYDRQFFSLKVAKNFLICNLKVLDLSVAYSKLPNYSDIINFSKRKNRYVTLIP